jgi:hypothetical protein
MIKKIKDGEEELAKQIKKIDAEYKNKKSCFGFFLRLFGINFGHDDNEEN